MYMYLLSYPGRKRRHESHPAVSTYYLLPRVAIFFFYHPLPFVAVMGRFAACFAIGLFSRSNQVGVGLSCATLLYPYHFVTLPLTCAVRSLQQESQICDKRPSTPLSVLICLRGKFQCTILLYSYQDRELSNRTGRGSWGWTPLSHLSQNCPSSLFIITLLYQQNCRMWHRN